MKFNRRREVYKIIFVCQRSTEKHFYYSLVVSLPVHPFFLLLLSLSPRLPRCFPESQPVVSLFVQSIFVCVCGGLTALPAPASLPLGWDWNVPHVADLNCRTPLVLYPEMKARREEKECFIKSEKPRGSRELSVAPAALNSKSAWWDQVVKAWSVSTCGHCGSLCRSSWSVVLIYSVYVWDDKLVMMVVGGRRRGGAGCVLGLDWGASLTVWLALLLCAGRFV